MTSQPHESEDVLLAQGYAEMADEDREFAEREFLAGRRAGLREQHRENDRLRGIIGGLYVARGGSRWDLYEAIKRAFRDMGGT